jgi:hypothetical protein
MATVDGIPTAMPHERAAELRIDVPSVLTAVWGLIVLVPLLGIWRELAAAAAGISTNDFGYDLVRLDGEANLPAAVSTLLLFAAAALLLVQSRIARPTGYATYWLILSVGFLYLALDEFAQLHEQLIVPLRAMAAFTDLLTFPWVIVAAPAVIIAATFFLPFLLRLPRGLAFGFVAAGLVYVGGALGMEMLNGRLTTYTGWGSPYYLVGTVIEETLELVGIGLFLSVLLRQMAAERAALRLLIA